MVFRMRNSGREAGENWMRRGENFHKFDRGTVNFRHMGCSSRKFAESGWRDTDTTKHTNTHTT